MKDITSEKFMFNFKRTMLNFFILGLVNILMPAVEATEMSAKRCFLYPISEYEPSPWYTIPENQFTVVILENMPMDLPVNITIKNYHTNDIYCLLSIKSINIRIYGDCISGEAHVHKLNGTIEDKTLVLHHVRESISYISVEDVVVNFNQVIADNYEQNHDESEWMDSEEFSTEMKPMVSDNNQYIAQITADISTDHRLHAAFGCEYDSDDECTMEFGKTILSVEDEISLLAISNSSQLEGVINVHYGTSEIKRSKPLLISLPSFDEDDDTWKDVVTIVPSFMDREDKDSYILHLNSNLIHSPRSPGLVGTVKEKKLILDFTNTTNIRWGVPCPEKPETLFDIRTAGITITPETDVEIINGSNSNESVFGEMPHKDFLNDKQNSDLVNQPEPEPEPTEEELTIIEVDPISPRESTNGASAKLVTGAQFVSHLVLLDFLIAYYFVNFF